MILRFEPMPLTIALALELACQPRHVIDAYLELKRSVSSYYIQSARHKPATNKFKYLLLNWPQRLWLQFLFSSIPWWSFIVVGKKIQQDMIHVDTDLGLSPAVCQRHCCLIGILLSKQTIVSKKLFRVLHFWQPFASFSSSSSSTLSSMSQLMPSSSLLSLSFKLPLSSGRQCPVLFTTARNGTNNRSSITNLLPTWDQNVDGTEVVLIGL